MAALLIAILQIATVLLIARAVLSWIRTTPGSAVDGAKQTLTRVTEPVLRPIRRFMPRLGGLDLSVLVVLLAINFLLIPVVATL
jgi:YggT family protein